MKSATNMMALETVVCYRNNLYVF
ncbi:hypothetical protein EMIT048CA2_60029 [Pseudomonas chlororaphis]